MAQLVHTRTMARLAFSRLSKAVVASEPRFPESAFTVSECRDWAKKALRTTSAQVRPTYGLARNRCAIRRVLVRQGKAAD